MEQRIRIVKCGTPRKWYADFIGNVFTVAEERSIYYVVAPNGRTVYKQDAELLPTEPEEKTIVVPKVTEREYVLEQLVEAYKKMAEAREEQQDPRSYGISEHHEIRISELEQQLNKMNAK